MPRNSVWVQEMCNDCKTPRYNVSRYTIDTQVADATPICAVLCSVPAGTYALSVPMGTTSRDVCYIP